ncbi:MAG: hypothetical protein EOO11_07995 [Chitinophagaceae bacterium]|nr:MAG: hypothetical protein EOO11_07995 [Chitinophagaceae bacterium]
MKRRILATVQALLLGCALLTACSKGDAAETSVERQQRQRTGLVADDKPKGPDYAPIPIDTLELDSLNRPGFN